MQMRAEGVKNPENFAGVICTCHAPLGLRRPATTNHHENREGMKRVVVIGLEFRLLSLLDLTFIYLRIQVLRNNASDPIAFRFFGKNHMKLSTEMVKGGPQVARGRILAAFGWWLIHATFELPFWPMAKKTQEERCAARPLPQPLIEPPKSRWVNRLWRGKQHWVDRRV